MGRINHVQQHLRRPHLFQRSFEGVHELVREFIDKPDRVNQEHGLTVRQIEPAAGWVQRGKQFCLRQRPRLGSADSSGSICPHWYTRPEQHRGREPAAGPADAENGCVQPRAVCGAGVAMRSRIRRRSTSSCDSPGATCPHSTTQARQVRPLARESGTQVFKLGKLNLQFTRLTVGALSKNIEDQLTPVDDLTTQRAF